MTLFETEVESALSRFDRIFIDEHTLLIEDVFIHQLEVSIHQNEVILYITFHVDEGIQLTSSDFSIMLENDEIRNPYQIDGLDYFKNPHQNMFPYVRFSVPTNTTRLILFINQYDKIFIEFDKKG
jgi:hypothetical protein